MAFRISFLNHNFIERCHVDSFLQVYFFYLIFMIWFWNVSVVVNKSVHVLHHSTSLGILQGSPSQEPPALSPSHSEKICEIMKYSISFIYACSTGFLLFKFFLLPILFLHIPGTTLSNINPTFPSPMNHFDATNCRISRCRPRCSRNKLMNNCLA